MFTSTSSQLDVKMASAHTERKYAHLKSLAAFVRQLRAWDEACADGRSSCWFETEGDLPRGKIPKNTAGERKCSEP